MTVRTRLQHWVMRQWLHRGWVSFLLRPFAALTARFVARKHADYAQGKRHAEHPGVPVIVIGNIFIGGTGKTPVVIAVTRALQGQGYSPGILSRGYGVAVGDGPRTGQHPIDPQQFGDEPALIARATGAPIAVHPRRASAARALLEAYPQVDILVSDDGLQHLALARDVEVVVQDVRGNGNGRLLPAGPLREPADRLKSVDVVITNRGAAPNPLNSLDSTPPADMAQPETSTTDAHSGLAKAGLTVVPSTPRRVDMHLKPGRAVHLQSGRQLELSELLAQRPIQPFAAQRFAAQPLAARRFAAVAGIGQPSRFFDMLIEYGITLTHTVALPDHYDFSASPFSQIDADVILITSKDSVKCAHITDDRLWEVPIDAVFTPADFPASMIEGLAARSRSAGGPAIVAYPLHAEAPRPDQ